MKYGFYRVAAAIPRVEVACPERNAGHITGMIKAADERGASVVVFPELSVTGYTCADLLLQERLLDAAETAVGRIAGTTKGRDITVIVGCPVRWKSLLYNCAVVMHGGKVAGIVPKQHLPNYGEFYEKRWFCPGSDAPGCTSLRFAGQDTVFGNRLLFATGEVTFGIELCEDLWAPVPPSTGLALAGAELIINTSADNEALRKHSYLRRLVSVHSAQTITAYAFTSAGYGESTTDTVFAGKSFLCENGKMLAEAARFKMDEQLTCADFDIELLRNERRTNMTYGSAPRTANDEYTTIHIDAKPRDGETDRHFDQLPFLPPADETGTACDEAFAIQTLGLAKRLSHIGCKDVVIGISGGLDSTLALLVCTKAFETLGLDPRGITAVTMPGFGTTDRTYHNALALMEALGVTMREISIRDACTGHFKDISHDANVHDTTYENAQARERTQILMDIANQVGGIVVGTGDLSELALGWATYNGDHMSMYGVNAGITKTMIRTIVTHLAENATDSGIRDTLLDIVATPISPELLPGEGRQAINQKTEDIVGPYELHDFFLYHLIKSKFSPDKIRYMACRAFDGIYDTATVDKWLRTFIRRFFTQQFKRSCLPDGPKVDTVTLSPRSDWRMPSDASFETFIN